MIKDRYVAVILAVLLVIMGLAHNYIMQQAVAFQSGQVVQACHDAFLAAIERAKEQFLQTRKSTTLELNLAGALLETRMDAAKEQANACRRNARQ